MSQLRWVLEVLLGASLAWIVSSADDHKDLLVSYLFNGYNQYVSPFVQRQNSQNNMDIAIRLSSVTVSSVNEQDFTVKVLVTVNYRWFDPHFRWEPSEYGNISRIAYSSQICILVTEVTVLTPDSMSALIRHDGLIIQDTNLVIIYNCPMNFDAFPFDRQSCQICFALDGFSGSNINLIDTPPDDRQLSSNSEWDFVSNLTIDECKTALDGLTTDTESLLFVQLSIVRYHFILARRSFFWVFLIVVPSCLICIVAQFGIFFSYAEIIVENAVSIGLNTMTSLMLAVTVLADFLAKTNNLPGLGWFVLMDIVIVCASVISILIIDHLRSFTI
ncbi:hypothetical protein PRIPAC_73895 [Pristionchus pacificus]|uniref:Transmembrane ion channel n=1 Tax=Pristionchus pacificus TaxID=54126 RepID=A0A2A6C5E7_PRIPA|nr:hypothetical protein PRIPAC_73895 [Pristionchus pacificus]|eukprot:PDM73337.1 transmembrane ion channel [Pristionchus pacificus]